VVPRAGFEDYRYIGFFKRRALKNVLAKHYTPQGIIKLFKEIL